MLSLLKNLVAATAVPLTADKSKVRSTLFVTVDVIYVPFIIEVVSSKFNQSAPSWTLGFKNPVAELKYICPCSAAGAVPVTCSLAFSN